MTMVLTREVSPSLAACELTHVTRAPIDVERARDQHRAFQHLLAAHGCKVFVLDADADHPDSVFVEDVVVVVDEVAVLTRPGAESRRGEGAAVEQWMSPYRRLLRIEAPGTLDGGDVLRIGRTLFVGQSSRSNHEGIAQLRVLLAPHGYEVKAVAIRDCLHLKSSVTQVAEDAVLVQPRWVDPSVFAPLRVIEVDPSEEHAANTLRIGATVLMPAGFPRTRQRLAEAGIETAIVDLSELQKAEGAITCCSVVFG